MAASSAENPYAVIGERNVFHLNPPPIPPPPEAPKTELPDIKLSGFLKIGKTTHALFVYTPKDKKEPPIYYDLVDGEKQGILEVVKIREDEEEVEVINSGTPTTLNLKENSLESKAPVAANTASEGRRRPSVFSQRGNPFAFPIPQRRTRMQ